MACAGPCGDLSVFLIGAYLAHSSPLVYCNICSLSLVTSELTTVYRTIMSQQAASSPKSPARQECNVMHSARNLMHTKCLNSLLMNRNAGGIDGSLQMQV